MMNKRILAAALAAAASLGLTAPVVQGASLSEKYDSRYERVQKIGGNPGRHIVDDGVGEQGREPSNERVAKSARLMLSWLRAARAPEPVLASSSTSTSSTQPATPVTTAATPTAGGPEQFVGCESGGDWGAVNPSTGAYGRYQLMPMHYGDGGLCEGMGKDQASQTECANRVYDAQGSGAWAQCGG